MRLRYLLLLIASLTSLIAASQTVITGNVTESQTRTPVDAANVMIKSPEGKILAFATTDTKGHFSLKISKPTEGMTVNVTVLGYKPYSQKIANESAELEIRLETGFNKLQEVVVRSNKIRERGDTVIYNVGSFARKQDKTIGDVIKRMPGLDVENNGRITYQGVDINKFYIEGSDLLGGKYGIATNGISHEDVGAVEVMENHQPMQVLRGVSYSDQAALNLKLKNKAKATLVANGNLGGGWSSQPRGALWQGDIFTMIVRGKYQMITTLKGNNTGIDQTADLFDFYGDFSEEKISRYTSIGVPTTPNLARKRSYFNRSWFVSSSQLWKTGSNTEVKAQIDYSHDRVKAYGNSTTSYFLDSGDKIILEDRSSLTRRNAITGKFTYEANAKAYYLNNTLKSDISWNSRALNTTGTLSNTQSAFRPEFLVSNNLQLIKRFGNRLVTFKSLNEWRSLPERLSVARGDAEYGERIAQNAFYTNERASLGFVIKRAVLSLDAGIAGYFRNLRTTLYGFEETQAPEDGAVTTDYMRVFVSPRFEWNYRRIELNLSVPLNLYSYFFSSGIKNRTEFFTSPTLNLRWHIMGRTTLSVRASARRSPANLHDIHNTAVMTDYRTFNTGADDYYTTSGQSVGAAFSYRNIYGLFLNASANYLWGKSKIGSMQDFIGDYVFYSYTSQPSRSQNFISYASVRKTVDFIDGAAGLTANYGHRKNSMYSQGHDTRYSGNSIGLNAFVSGSFTSMFNWDLKFVWNREEMKIEKLNSRSTDNFLYQGSFTLTPCRLITWTAGGEFYRNEIESGRFKNMFMLDTKVTFNISRRFEISASLNNILNRKSYSYTSYGALSSFEQSSSLRGREFLISFYLKK